DVEVVGEAHDLASAATAVGVTRPDVVFLDIDMPGGDGFQLVRTLAPPLPWIVFATAYSEFALQAFEVEALDYLLKPFDAERLGRVITRVRERCAAQEGLPAARVEALLARLQDSADNAGATRGAGWAQRVLVQEGGEMRFVRVADIVWLSSADNYVELHAGAAVHLVRDTLAAVEQRLDPATFLRVHRRAIVNLDFVTSIRARATGQLEVLLEGGHAVAVGRAYHDALTRRWHDGRRAID
ncbi:MAG: response regulator transcription factor, partial [Candidatus Eisenbacteria bacterium]|nr:response regulator transcription factor [Candidatus Eisenbacteria bacterium]